MSAAVSRRGFFSALARPLQRRRVADGLRAEKTVEPDVQPGALLRTAVIQGRFCIALTSFCSACTERCPVPGAMTRDHGLPMVHADLCTGCGICHDVCPAPRKAVLMLPRRTPSSVA